MKLIYNKIFLEHETGMHPENKKRLESLKLKESKIDKNGEKFLPLIHTKKYIKKVKKTCKESEYLDPDTITSKKTYDVACAAVKTTIDCSKEGNFAIVRPPGHHAHKDKSSGFCIFNNLAISVKNLVNEGKKVLIFDFDGHLGDGTKKIFYNSNKVFYFSLHQYPAFPGSGWANEIGKGKGKGYTLNIPLPKGTGDDIYFKELKKYLWILKKFEPDVVAISAGFDAHKEDLLLDLKLSSSAFYKIGQIIRKNFKNYYATLEGGYNINTLKSCVMNFQRGINNQKIYKKDNPTKSRKEIKKEMEKRTKLIEKNINKYWKK